MGPFTETKWVVCHGPGVVHFSKLPIGSSMMTGQPNCEHFDTEEEGLARAIELGCVPPIEDEPLHQSII
jgi:hypothetical protein